MIALIIDLILGAIKLAFGIKQITKAPPKTDADEYSEHLDALDTGDKTVFARRRRRKYLDERSDGLREL